MSNSIIIPGEENAARLGAVREFARLQTVNPSPAMPLTDEDLAIFIRQQERCGLQFTWYAKAAYLDYFFFYGTEMGKALEQCTEKL